MTDLDQFYTNHDIADHCIKILKSTIGDFEKWDWIVEPSAGSGSFFHLLPNQTIGIDLEPTTPGILQADFFKWEFPKGKGIVIGNPPFGKNSSLAVQFFNRSAIHAEVIAFILPRTFRKPSIINRLNFNFELKYNEVLPLDSFHLPNGKKRKVPTCFQIWLKSDFKRNILTSGPDTHPHWTWCNYANATHALRRVGIKAGRLLSSRNASPASHYFIKSCIDISLIEKNFENLWNNCWSKEITPHPKWDVAGNPSLSKSEIVADYHSFFG